MNHMEWVFCNLTPISLAHFSQHEVDKTFMAFRGAKTSLGFASMGIQMNKFS